MTIRVQDITPEFAAALLTALADSPDVDVRYTVAPHVKAADARAQLTTIVYDALVKAATPGLTS
jgi:hypothetical protein